MIDYSTLLMPWSRCVRFVRSSEIDDETRDMAEELRESELTWCYVDGKEMLTTGVELADAIGENIGLEHRPYGAGAWVRFLDDLIGASEERCGLVIIVDNAHLLQAARPSEFYDLIESFLLQWHHWFEKKKPCHLCLQMESDGRVREFFAYEKSR